MGHIRKRGERYYAEVHVDGVRKGKTHRTKREAQQWVNEVESGLRPLAIGEYRLSDLAERYVDEVISRRKGAKQDALRFRRLVEELPDRPISKLGPNDISQWKVEKLKQVQGPTVRRYMSVLNGFFEHALHEWQAIERNPMVGVKKPPNNPPRNVYPLDSDIELILQALGYEEEAPVVTHKQQVAVTLLLALETAMRAGEMLSLSRSTVDYGRRVAVLERTKNGDRREVPLSSRAVELLRKVEPDYFTVSSALHSQLFRLACIDAGIEGLRFHDSRAAGLMRLSKKVDVLTLARIAGMRDTKTLMIYYRESAEDIARRLG